MSRIDDLIEEHHPDGVPHSTLAECGDFVRGNGLQKIDLIAQGVPAIHYGQIHTTYGTWTDRTKSFVSEELAARLRKAEPGNLVIATTSEDDEAVGKAVAWVGDSDVVVSGDAYIYRHSLNPKFVAYFFQTESFRRQKMQSITGTKVRRISSERLSRVRIPVPHPLIQREIVQVLDSLQQLNTDLTADLRSEMDARRIQYFYYRNDLLAFDDPAVQRLPMGKVGSFIRGRRFTKSDVVPSGIPSIHYGEIYTHYGVAATSTISSVRSDLADQLRFAQPNDVVIATVGETVEDVAKAVAWLGTEPVAIHDDTCAFRSEMDPTFVSYLMQSSPFQAQKDPLVARAKVKRINSDALGTIVIPVPGDDDQKRVVAVLDRLAALVNETSTALSAEIEARRQQYKHYRDRLLTFDEAAA